MDSVNITICGTMTRETLSALCELAIRAGLGIAIPPRASDVQVETLAPVTSAPRRLPPARAKAPETAKAPKPSDALPAFSKTALNQTAADRRVAILAKLRGTGDIGMSFKALLMGVKPHLVTAGDQDQQVAALRNALSTLGREGRVHRVAGQWLATQPTS